MPTAHSPLSRAFLIFSSMIDGAIYVEWLFLKPNCFLLIILHLLTKLNNLLYISFSSIFENIGSREIGLQLLKIIGSFALYKCDTRATFSSLGNTPCENDRVVRRVNGVATWSDIHFNPLDIIPSLPGAPSFNCAIIFFTSESSTGLRKNDMLFCCGIKCL